MSGTLDAWSQSGPGYSATPRTGGDARRLLRRRLAAIASERGTDTYAAVGWPLGLEMRNPRHRGDLGALLDAIDRHEHGHGRPLLAAVVVLAQTGRPSRGFFRNARDLGRLTDEDEVAFWEREVRRVHAYWAAETAAD